MRSCCTKSSERAIVSGVVRSPTITSTSGMRSTGEKKCKPMNCAGRCEAVARPVIGSVEVLLAKIAVLGSTASALRVTSALMPVSSNTASTTRSQPARSA